MGCILKENEEFHKWNGGGADPSVLHFRSLLLGSKSHYQLVTLHSPAEFISIWKLNENQIIVGFLTVNISSPVQPPSQFRVSS